MIGRIFVCTAASPALLVALLTAGATAHLHAASSPERQQLEVLQQQVRELQARVARLEANADHGWSFDFEPSVQPLPGGWREADNWKLLGKGMEEQQVLQILGEPEQRKAVNKFEFWSYGDGKVKIYMGRLHSVEPPSTQ
jgi:hypothetical protein